MSTRRGHEPVRSCIACRTRRPKRELRRYVRIGNEVVADPEQKMTGRGCYVCDDERCLVRAVKKGAFKRAFRNGNVSADSLWVETGARRTTPKPESGVSE